MKRVGVQGRWTPPALMDPWVGEADGDAREDLTSPITADVQRREGKLGKGHTDGLLSRAGPGRPPEEVTQQSA